MLCLSFVTNLLFSVFLQCLSPVTVIVSNPPAVEVLQKKKTIRFEDLTGTTLLAESAVSYVPEQNRYQVTIA